MSQTPDSPARQLLLEVYREQRGRLWGFFVRATDSRETAEDLLQETFLHSWDHVEENAHDGADREGMRRVLWRIGRNAAIDAIRERARRRSRSGEGDGTAALASGEPSPHEIVELEDCRRVVRQTVGLLRNRRVRRCLELWLAGMDLAGIAREMGIGAGQVRGLLQRGRSEVVLRALNALRVRGGSS